MVTLICYFFHNNSCSQETAVWEEARASRNARKLISNADGMPGQKEYGTGSNPKPAPQPRIDPLNKRKSRAELREPPKRPERFPIHIFVDVEPIEEKQRF
jgi:hypothetical protein